MGDAGHLETAHIVDAINTGRSDPLTLDHRFSVGSGAGAYSIRMANGNAAVLKWWPVTPAAIRDSRLRAPRIHRLRELGWPVPTVLEAGSTPETIFEIWEIAPGQAGVHQPISGPVVSQAIALLGRAKGAALGDGSDWPGWLTESIESAIARAEPNAGPAAQNMLVICQGAIDAVELSPGHDIIHGDFTPANCLLDGDRILAVIDFEACQDGDGTIDLIGMAWDLEGWDNADPAAIELIWRKVWDSTPPETVRALLAYWIASTLAWAAGTEWESHAVDTSQRAWLRVTQGD